jgi:predicted nucleotidyltransferase
MDTESLLKSLNAHNVEYVIIGATAFPVHGYSRATLGIDIFIRPTEGNCRNAWLALKVFGYAMTDVSVAEMQSNKILIRQYMLETDIHPYVKGITFGEIWQNKVAAKIGDTDTYFASLDDLIKMKKAAGRGKDKEDLKVLEKLKEKKPG